MSAPLNDDALKIAIDTLESVGSWIKHWETDVECSLPPTVGSLHTCAIEVAAAVAWLKERRAAYGCAWEKRFEKPAIGAVFAALANKPWERPHQ